MVSIACGASRLTGRLINHVLSMRDVIMASENGFVYVHQHTSTNVCSPNAETEESDHWLRDITNWKQDGWQSWVAATLGSTKTNSVPCAEGTCRVVVLMSLQLCTGNHMPQSLTLTCTHTCAPTAGFIVSAQPSDNIELSVSWEIGHFDFVEMCRAAFWIPGRRVCFDRCTKAYKRQSEADTCEAHWVWTGSSEVCLQCQLEAEPQWPSIFLDTAEILVFNRRPVWNKAKVTSIDYSRGKSSIYSWELHQISPTKANPIKPLCFYKSRHMAEVKKKPSFPFNTLWVYIIQVRSPGACQQSLLSWLSNSLSLSLLFLFVCLAIRKPKHLTHPLKVQQVTLLIQALHVISQGKQCKLGKFQIQITYVLSKDGFSPFRSFRLMYETNPNLWVNGCYPGVSLLLNDIQSG